MTAMKCTPIESHKDLPSADDVLDIEFDTQLSSSGKISKIAGITLKTKRGMFQLKPSYYGENIQAFKIEKPDQWYVRCQISETAHSMVGPFDSEELAQEFAGTLQVANTIVKEAV